MEKTMTRRFTDPEFVFHYWGSDGGFEQTLEANEDGTLTYDRSPNHYARGEKGTVATLTPAEAKARFRGYDEKIDSAFAYMRSQRRQ
jgi:hypothetical protein